ncbi:zinc finger protein [Ophiocordyceps sinensis CO18]|uniref:Zinc finger protein n=1 Tax=Ophiocordyceps sinensis (strain Co18 / CGMCC 3.14243) TaxID=911162 RepID=T5ANQ5_OPHSC|nr:zinc finger protein [Ophiocordyceps sinensis CO18]
MQPWPDQGQNGPDGHDSWHSSFMFSAQPGQFDPNQEQWHDQPMTGQAATFSQIGHDLPDAAAQDYDFDSVHHGAAGAFLGDQHLANPQPGQGGFHGAAGHGSIPLNQHQHFSSANQDILDPSFTNIHPDLFGSQQQQRQHQGKVDLAGTGIGQLGVGQGQNHGQVFAQHDYSFPPQGGQPFNPSPGPAQAPQFTPPPLMPRPSPQSHTPLQQHFDGSNNLHTGFSQNQTFARPPQQNPLHHHRQQQQQQSKQQQPRPYSAADQQFAPSTNGQPDHYQVGPHSHLTYPQFPEQAAQSHLQQYTQAAFGSSKPNTFQPPGPGSIGSIPIDEQARQPQAVGLQTSPAAGHAQSALIQQPSFEADEQSSTKKRKRSTRSVSEAASVESPAPVGPDQLLADSAARRAEDVASLQAPVPSAGEASLLAESTKRSKLAQRRLPSAKALPHHAHCGTIKLPVPKSYDKLAPLVAVPPRSGKPAVPGLGYDLPCEVQGRFTSQYKPSFDKPGLDERREEAKDLLDNYDRSMMALGKRQPKYTEYPHAFKEQLKADEASKNKAEKRAKKELEEVRSKPFRTPMRPADPSAAAAWDIIGIVHIDQVVPRTSALIAGRVQQAGESLITLRGEANRAKLALDQATKDKKPEADIARLRREADRKKETLYQALDAIVEHADDAVLDNLGGHQKLVLSLVNTLISCIKAGDFSGKLAKIVLELFTHLTMTKKIIETTNFDTVRKRLEDKGDDEVKDLVREISSKVRKFTRANESDTATGYTGTSAASRAKTGTKTSGAGDAASAKRSRDDDSDLTRNVKKIAVEPGSSSSLSKKLGQPKSHPQFVPRASVAVASKPSTSILPGKPRPVPKPASKPQEPLAAADSPSTSADERGKPEAKRATAKLEAKAATMKKETKPSTAAGAVSSISSLLDSINAKKPDPVAVTLAAASREGKRSQTPETPEQTAKRLRKEARRRLRVSWKPEGELVQIKVFEKDDDEDGGRDMNMIRDAADDRSEGMVLKRRANEMLEDEDDDIPYRPWTAPTTTDLSNLPEEMRTKSYVTRGGSLVLDTEEQKLMAEREQRELMVIYTDPADIPPTPKSPPPEAPAIGAETKVGRLPEDEPMFNEIHLRWKEGEQMGIDQAFLAATKRLNPKGSMSTKLDSILGRLHQSGPRAGRQSSSSTTQASAAGTASAAMNVNVPLAVGPAVEAYVLGWLRWDRIGSWRDPNPIHVDASRVHQYSSPDVQAAGKVVEGVATSLAGKPYPASSPPEWLVKDGERVREWWLGYNKEITARQRRMEEESARAGAEAGAVGTAGQAPGNAQDWSAYYAQQQQAYAPYMALLQRGQQPQPQPQPQHLTQQPSVAAAALGHQPQILDSQLQSMLAAINQPGQQQQQSGHAQSSNAGGYEAAYQAFSQASQSQQQASAYSGDRDWDRSDNQAGRVDQHKGDAKDGRKKKGTLPPHKPVNKALIGTKPCTFWQQGKCARGDKCTFRHD